ncbi:MAG TPA: adenylate/guanylate cyclase domain-containing protein [Gaiellaceae bacterium]|nr:adenylate/guanylate cyclase domain-containing protein [Gaiellaceae bacterium]
MPGCATCGERLPSDARYCPRCGAAVAVAEPESRRTVTVLFCDVVDSTPLAERLDAEAMRSLLGRWFEVAEEAVRLYGGTVEKFVGDAVMAVFGLPRAHEDDALRAVLAALELRERLAALDAELAASTGARLAIRTGVNTGLVVAGDASAGQRLVTGDAVNVAKRLEQAAAPGEVLVGAATAALVRDAATLVPLPALAAKGKSEPVAAWRVVDADRALLGVARRLDAPLVDREAELASLGEALARCERRRSGVLVTVTGAPGIGKSRLARELVRLAGARNRCLVARCPAYGHAITYRPVAELLEHAGGEAALRAALAGDPERELVLELVRAATGTPSAATASDEIFWAIRRTLEAFAVEHPCVVVLDDAQWAEPTLLDLVEYLSTFAQAPLLLVCLARPELLESRPAWPGERLELEPLSVADADRLLERLGVGDGHRRRVAEAAEGNPLFLEQLSAMLADGERGDERMPPSLRALLDERLDRLAPEERRALMHASVIGREFSLASLRALAAGAGGGALAARLLSLVRKGLLRPGDAGETPEERFRFRHALIRDAAYERLAKSERATLHERYARWFAERAREDDGGVDEIVGFHLEQAHRALVELGRAGEAAPLAAAAHARLASSARRALAREDMPAAVKLLERAIAIPVDARARAALRLELIQALWELGDAAAAEREVDALLAEARELADERLEAAALVERAANESITGAGGTEAVRAAARAAIERFETRLGDDQAFLFARAWRRIATAESKDGRYRDSAAAAEVALRHARAAGNPLEVARIVDALSTALLYGPTPVDDALRECELLLAEARGTPSLEANVLCAMAGLEAMRDRGDAAREAYARAAEAFESRGLVLPRAGQTQVGVAMELLLGDPTAALREARRGYEILATIASEQIQAPLVAEALLELGREDEAAALVDPIEPAARPYLVAWQVRCRIVKARIATARGDAGTAASLAAAAVELAQRTDDPTLAGDAFVALAEALEAAAARERAAVALADALGRYRAKGNIAAARRIEAAASVAG